MARPGPSVLEPRTHGAAASVLDLATVARHVVHRVGVLRHRALRLHRVLARRELEARMCAARLTAVLDDEWLNLEPVRVFAGPTGRLAPVAYALLDVDGHRLRVDVYADEPDCYAFEAAVEWRGNMVIGFGSHVHIVGISDRQSTTVHLGGYFSGLYPLADCLLVASQDRVWRVDPNQSIRWRSQRVGLDGVVLHPDPASNKVTGDGEWDPPGGWQSFTLDLETGTTL
jgi:hypothetical protein